MRASQILQQQFEVDLPRMHAARAKVLFAAVFTLVRSGRLSLTSLGRAIAVGTSQKHGIKRVDRLLGNTKLQAEQIQIYRAIARRLIAPGSKPVVLVDWTAVTAKLWALVAAVPLEGRALVVYAEAHPIGRYLKPEVNAAFLDRLQLVLPSGCTPILVADAGFRSPWMRLVASHGWDYVVRARAPAKVRHDRGEAWVQIEDVWRYARSTPSDLGQFEIGRKGRHVCRFVGIRKRARRLVRPAIRDYGNARQLRNAREPWILATSLDCSAAKVIGFYRARMQIEETFRDAKSPHFGMSLSQARPRTDFRANALLLLAALAHLVAILLGLAAERTGLQRRYQANTSKDHRVLSLAMLGRLIATDHQASVLRRALSAHNWLALAHAAQRPSAG